jgi:hypothetical protein
VIIQTQATTQAWDNLFGQLPSRELKDNGKVRESNVSVSKRFATKLNINSNISSNSAMQK